MTTLKGFCLDFSQKLQRKQGIKLYLDVENDEYINLCKFGGRISSREVIEEGEGASGATFRSPDAEKKQKG